MEIKLVARLLNASEPTETREAFWGQVTNRFFLGPGVGRATTIQTGSRSAAESAPPARGISPEEGERRVFRDFPRFLEQRFGTIIAQRRQSWPMLAAWRQLFQRPPVLPANKFIISVKSVDYGSLEILLSFLAGDDFPLNAREIVQILEQYAADDLGRALRAVGLAVLVANVTGSLQGDGPYATTDQPTLMRRAFHLANLSLFVPTALFLWVCYLAYNAMIDQRNAASDDRKALLVQMVKVDAERTQLTKEAIDLIKESRSGLVEPTRHLVEVAVRLDGERSQLAKDTLEFVREVRTNAGDERRELAELRKRLAGMSTGPGSGGPPEGRVVLKTSKITVYSTELNFDPGDLAKTVLEEAVKAGPDQIRKVMQAIGEAVDVGRKTVAFTSDIVDLIRKIWPPDSDGTICLNCRNDGRQVVTLLDRRVNFEFEKARLDRATEDALHEVARTLRESQKSVLIEGHADGQGATDLNRDLSQCRAYAVKAFLEKEGIPGRQMHAYGYGFGHLWLPWVPADGANRRVRVIECTAAGEDRCKSAANLAGRMSVDCRKFGLN